MLPFLSDPLQQSQERRGPCEFFALDGNVHSESVHQFKTHIVALVHFRLQATKQDLAEVALRCS